MFLHIDCVFKRTNKGLLALSVWMALPSGMAADPGATELAKRPSNPVAALISVPLQLNYDADVGADDRGERWTPNMQPVFPGAGSQSGLGDIVQSAFFSAKAPGPGGPKHWAEGPPAAPEDLAFRASVTLLFPK